MILRCFTKGLSSLSSSAAGRKAIVKLTPAAASRIRQLSEANCSKGLLKISLRSRGCSGLAYHLEFVSKPGAYDEQVEQNGACILIDSKAIIAIIGSEIDFEQTDLSSQFTFRNPNVRSTCGCGHSFNT